MRTIRASEIGTFLYCRRAWWYQRQGVESENQAELVSGTALHEQHGRTVMTAGCLRSVAYACLLLAVLLVIVYVMGRIL